MENVSFLLGKITKSKTSGSYDKCVLTLLCIPNSFPTCLYNYAL